MREAVVLRRFPEGGMLTFFLCLAVFCNQPPGTNTQFFSA